MATKTDNTLERPVAICDQSQKENNGISTTVIENMILIIRGKQVMIDKDLAALYSVDTKRLNEQVRRNAERFPKSFKFQLSEEEKSELVANCDRFNSLKHSTSLPYAFTEQGIAMLSSVLHSDTAVQVSIKIMEAFVAMRHYLLSNASILQHLEMLDRKQLENDQKFKLLFSKFEQELPSKQGIFYDGQSFDAYSFVSNLIREANKRIVLIDNYVDDTVLTMLDKRKSGVSAAIHTLQISKSFQLDIDKHNAQYPAIDVVTFKNAHDRFLIIDDKVYHFGASIKDLGKKWFAVSLMTELTADELLIRINH